MSLGRKIRDIRQERGLTLTNLAQKLGISPSYLSLVERDIKKPSVVMLNQISSHLHISTSYLVTDASDNGLTGDKLRSLRENRGLRLEDLAELSEIPLSDLMQIENNTLRPNNTYLERLSQALNVTVRFLIDSTPKDIHIGERLKLARQKAGLSQTQLGQATALSSSLISQLENNVTVPSLETLDKIAKCLSIDPSQFFQSDMESPGNLSNLNPELITLLENPKILAILNAVRDFEPNEITFALYFLEFFKKNRHIL